MSKQNEDLREKLVIMYFNMLVKGTTMASVANLSDATLKRGEGFIDEVVELLDHHISKAVIEELEKALKWFESESGYLFYLDDRIAELKAKEELSQ